MAKWAPVVIVIMVLSLLVACAPPAPTPTLAAQPTATLAEVRVTKAEHLAGIWRLGGGEDLFSPTYGGRYYRWDPDGTVWWAENSDMTGTLFSTRYWFEDGVYYEEESSVCLGNGSYGAYVVIEGGTAARLRLEVIEDGSSVDGCPRGERYMASFRRVD
jgi:hypothetical protein